jgi:hypothetical protein
MHTSPTSPIPAYLRRTFRALSHEVGEWLGDPLVDGYNSTPCGGYLEIGDPLTGSDYPYVLHNFTYHLQDLVSLKYFGGDPSEPVNGWWTFQNDSRINMVCQFGP